ncbi:hypothetical protein JTB14_013083 [Gonioctena quinquepunctata]|nr:hypothetical protein JTB14_013083 [Gonioctena quinquepunctata]
MQQIEDEINIKPGKVIKEEIKEDYNKINLNLDKIYNILSQINVPPNRSVVDLPLEEDLLKSFSFPLVSCEQIQALDNEIRNNPEFKAQLITFLSKIGGTSRQEDGGKVAYKRKELNSKKTLQILEGILDVFFQVISLADSRHTKQKTCNIFKDGVLKYAVKRSLRKRYKLGSAPF